MSVFTTRYKSLSRVIKKTLCVSFPLFLIRIFILLFVSSGHMKDSLLYMVHGAKSKRDGQGFWRDAKLLEKSMAGLGTRDTQLIYRFVFFIYFLFLITHIFLNIDLSVLIGTLGVLKLSKMLINDAMGNHLKCV